MKVRLIHQIDSIYQGEINSSYQKHGFGMLQTEDFCTYLGNWKNGKANGLGLLCYPNGEQIYGNFKDDIIDGLCLAANSNFFQCGIVKDNHFVGLGVQHIMSTGRWKLNKFFKGVAIEVVKEVEDSDSLTLIDPSLLEHCTNYQRHNYFPKKSEWVQVQDGTVRLGLEEGLYVQGVQTGCIATGLLHGYQLLVNQGNILIGRYVMGTKQGLFFEKGKERDQFLMYQQDRLIAAIPQATYQTLRKQQRTHSYRQIDYMTIKNNISFEIINQIFNLTSVNLWKISATQKNKKNSNHYLQTKKDNSLAPKIQTSEKTSVEIIQKKISNIKNISKTSLDKNKIQKNLKLQQSIAENQENRKNNQIQNEQIAQEINPFIEDPYKKIGLNHQRRNKKIWAAQY